jgi:electron transport complex protein RnfD
LKELAQLGSAASPAAVDQVVAQLPSVWDMLAGNIAGSLGETSVVALLIGAAYLFYKGHIDWRIPGTFIGTVGVLTGVFAAVAGRDVALFSLYHLLSGGLMLGAFFMATDWVTSPITKGGRIIFGLGCGILTVMIRLWGGYPEGVCYSILLMNCATPLIDRYAKPRVYGRRKNA